MIRRRCTPADRFLETIDINLSIRVKLRITPNKEK